MLDSAPTAHAYRTPAAQRSLLTHPVSLDPAVHAITRHSEKGRGVGFVDGLFNVAFGVSGPSGFVLQIRMRLLAYSYQRRSSARGVVTQFYRVALRFLTQFSDFVASFYERGLLRSCVVLYCKA